VTILLFIVILGVLVFAHELGHFSLAKWFGIRVDEFAIGFPPRIISKKVGETEYSINLIPLGGYVKIYGEDMLDHSADLDPDASRSLTAKNRFKQALVLVGGITANILFAWVLLSIVFMVGAPVSKEQYTGTPLHNEQLMVLSVLADSPAGHAGLQEGDVILEVSAGTEVVTKPSVKEVQGFIASHEGKAIMVNIIRKDAPLSLSVVPQAGIVNDRAAIGISMDEVGTLKLSFFPALLEGAKRTIDLFILVAQSIGIFFYQMFSFQADFSQISGPVGIATMVGNAQALGWFYLISFTALISLNLAVINLIPFPALDGGRLFFLLIETVIRRPLPVKFVRYANGIGFMILIGLLILVTYKDVMHLI